MPTRPPKDWKQNTDPFVFGDHFHYTGCLQHTRFGPTQLRYLAPGTVILFGSRVNGGEFALDTVLVVDRYLDHSVGTYAKVRRQVSSGYAVATLDPWYRGDVPTDRSHRLYFGATFDRPLEGMFSFVPALPSRDAPQGFARATLDVPDAITPTMAQGKRLNPQPSIGAVRRLWDEVVRQVRAQGLELATFFDLPPIEAITDGGTAGGRRRC